MASVIALIFAVILYIIIQVFKSPSSTGNYDDGYYHHSNTNDRYDNDDHHDNDSRCDNDSSCDSGSSDD